MISLKQWIPSFITTESFFSLILITLSSFSSSVHKVLWRVKLPSSNVRLDVFFIVLLSFHSFSGIMALQCATIVLLFSLVFLSVQVQGSKRGTNHRPFLSVSQKLCCVEYKVRGTTLEYAANYWRFKPGALHYYNFIIT